jgi:hypothetical protein
MGWLSMPLASMGEHRTPKTYLDAQFTYFRAHDDGSITDRRVVASSCLNNRTYYAAVQNHDNGAAGDIYAIICLVRWNPRASDGFVFSYKDMDETMGPYEAECPERILRLLTPTTHEYAIDWRRRCHDNLQLRARPITDGMRIRLAEPLTFSDDYVGDDFIVSKRGASITLRPVDRHGYYCIRNFRTHAWSPVVTTTVHRTMFAALPAK